MACADFRVKPTLTGERVVLRPFTSDDASALLEAMADAETARLAGSRLDPVAEDDHICQWYATRNAQPDRLDLAVVDRATGRCVGRQRGLHLVPAHPRHARRPEGSLAKRNHLITFNQQGSRTD